MPEGTRLIFWLDTLLVILLVIFAILGKWDWVLAITIALFIINLTSRLPKI